MYVVECTVDGKPKWLATKGPGDTNYLATTIEKAFVFEDETVANLYSKIWSTDTTACRIVRHNPKK